MIGDGDSTNNNAFEGCFWVIIACLVFWVLFSYILFNIFGAK